MLANNDHNCLSILNNCSSFNSVPFNHILLYYKILYILLLYNTYFFKRENMFVKYKPEFVNCFVVETNKRNIVVCILHNRNQKAI